MPKPVSIDDSNRLFSVLRTVAERSPNRRAWIERDGTSRSWRQLHQDVLRLAMQLHRAGVRPGDRVLTRVKNSYRAVLLALAIPAINAIESPIDHRIDETDVLRMARRIGARMVAGEAIRPIGFAENTQVDFPDLSRAGLILWTSGTTRLPEPVVHDWEGILHNARGKLLAAPQSEHDIRLTVLPLSHAYARTCDFVTWLLSGCTLSAGEGWRGIQELGPLARPTLLNAVPYLIEKMIPDDGSTSKDKIPLGLDRLGLDRLRMLGCGGAALADEQFERIQTLGIVPIHGYGLTETGPVICSASPDDARPGVVGRPIHDTRVRISVEGEIECRGPGMMLGYWNDRGSTAARFTSDGWFRTGDRGELESDGMLKILGRLDDVIVLSTGRKFWPLALEQRLGRVAGVLHVIVRGNGTGLEAVVDASSGINPEKLLSAFQQTQDQHNRDEPRITKVTMLTQPLSREAGNLTHKGTVKRWSI